MDKFYGFISREGFDKDLFFHGAELTNVHFDDLEEGDAVEFEVVDGEKGPKAIKIALVEAGDDAPAEA